MIRLQTVGFWFNAAAPGPYPRPQALVGPWDPAERATVLAYLRDGKQVAAYMGWSECRFCGEHVGNLDLGDGFWLWPEGLPHYVEHHDVQLPEELVATAVAAKGVVQVERVPRPGRGSYTDVPWLTWARSRGACVDLRGWEVPGSIDREKITAALGFQADIVLARADTRHVVVARAGGALEIHQLTPDRPPPRHLAGWDEWPYLPPGAD